MTESSYTVQVVPTVWLVRIDALATAPGNTPEAIGFVQAATLASLTLTNPNQFLYV
jgi:hypothetical protein